MPYEFYITPEEYEEAEKNGICRSTLTTRVRDLGWDKKRAITEQVRKLKDIREWAKIAEQNGIPYNTFKSRVNKLEWSMEKAATHPHMSREEAIKINRRVQHKYPDEIIKLAGENGIEYETFRHRVANRGWNLEKAATTPPMTTRERGLLYKQRLREMGFKV